MKCKQTGRCLLLTICILQLISTAERQLFDFLGRMWLPILCNFFNFIFVIFGFFGAYQYKPKYIIIYLTWTFFWLAWNMFAICFYLNVGSLSNKSDWLNFGTGSASWWEVNGIGCEPVYPTNLTQVDVSRPLRPVKVNGCILNFEYVEAIHASFQCAFCVPGIIVSIYLIKKFSGHDRSFEFIGGYDCNTYAINSENGHSYPIRCSASGNLCYSPGAVDDHPNYAILMHSLPQYSLPMHCPHCRGCRCLCNYHHNEYSKGKKKPSSIYYVEYSSPTREETDSPDLEETSYQQPMTPRKVKRQNRYRSSGRSQGRGTQLRNSKGRGTHPRSSQRSRKPQYLNPVTQLIDKANESSTSTDSYRRPVRPPTFGGRQGHSNPMYVHSRPNSTYSLNNTGAPPDPVERPPSVHSSYSNYHGQRPSINPNPLPNGNTYRNSAFLGSTHRKARMERPRSTFHPHPEPSPNPQDSTFSGDTYSENERPPPYMFGINSETVI